MKFSFPSFLTLIAGLLLATTSDSHAQRPGGLGGGPMSGPAGAGMGSSMGKFFGDVKAFSATATMRVLDKSQKETTSMVMGYAFDNGKIRMEMDLSKMKNAQMSPQAIAAMKQMGMDRSVIITIPEKRVMLMVYPGLQSYAEMPVPDASSSAAAPKDKDETKEIGNETVDGHPCVKNQHSYTSDSGKTQAAITWNATDLKGFPVQIQIEDKATGSTTMMLYKDIKLTAPDSKEFQTPDGFTKYDNIQMMMQAVMMKRLGGAAGGAPPHP
jgi:outer membrane lipoprotein-sorting protein